MLRSRLPGAEVTTDIIVGFPGETEEDYLATEELVKKADFASAFTFVYSPRTGTKAAAMENQVPEEVQKDRILLPRRAGQFAHPKKIGKIRRDDGRNSLRGLRREKRAVSRPRRIRPHGIFQERRKSCRAVCKFENNAGERYFSLRRARGQKS